MVGNPVSTSEEGPKRRTETRMPGHKRDDSWHNEAEAALRALFRSEYAPPIPSEIEGADATPEVHKREDSQRMSVQFAADRIRNRFPEPVRRLEERYPFELWLEAVIQDLHLLPKKINAALNQGKGFVERIIAGEVAPWQLSAAEGADVVTLFRLHFDSLPNLLRWSVAARRMREAEAQSDLSYPPLDEAPPDAQRLSDMVAAHVDASPKLPGEVEAWLIELRAELGKRQAYDFLN